MYRRITQWLEGMEDQWPTSGINVTTVGDALKFKHWVIKRQHAAAAPAAVPVAVAVRRRPLADASAKVSSAEVALDTKADAPLEEASVDLKGRKGKGKRRLKRVQVQV